VDTEPIAVGLKFAFLAVLYLFLLWVGRSALKELRTTSNPAPEATGFHDIGGPGGRAPSTDADIRIDDKFASQIHCRIYSRGPSYYVEDMGSTNGTYLNGSRFRSETLLSDLDEIRIGDTELRFEIDVPGS
jgi:predicted component of type VI protein secretion system